MIKCCSFGKVRTSVWEKTFELLNIKFYVMEGELCESSTELVKAFDVKHFDLFWLTDGYILVARKDGQTSVIFNGKNVTTNENKGLEECIFSKIEQVDVWKEIFKALNVRFYVYSTVKLYDVLTRVSEKIETKHFDLYEINDSYLALAKTEAKTYVIFAHKIL